MVSTIDRAQEIRLLGSFADVNRYSEALSAGEHWPWEANMAYAAHEVRHFNFEATREARLAAEEDVTVVSAWSDEVLSGDVETDVNFPTAEQMTQFDTLEIDLTMDCPDPEGEEFGNCGAWDYLPISTCKTAKMRPTGLSWRASSRPIIGRGAMLWTQPLLSLTFGAADKGVYAFTSARHGTRRHLTQMDFQFVRKTSDTDR